MTMVSHEWLYNLFYYEAYTFRYLNPFITVLSPTASPFDPQQIVQ